jgi:tetratricopeptide (TPR) repeat protein
VGPVAGSSLLGGGFVYANPFFVKPADEGEDPYTSAGPASPDYSRPLPLPTEGEEDEASEAVVTEAMDRFGQARVHFKHGRYANALAEVEAALRVLPGDRSMQEFRGLTLFAGEQYREAAAVVYAVLAAGPGWDEETMLLLYPDERTYPRQLGALKDHTLDHPGEGAAHFLLAYHYLVLEKHAPALFSLRRAARLAPRDRLLAGLIDSLSRRAGKADSE